MVDELAPVEPRAAEWLQTMEDDLLAYASFPPAHWSKICPIEWLDQESKCRTDVVRLPRA